MNHDAELLRQYVEERSEAAFTELVREHLNLVYSAALRETAGDAALAEDLSQAVFTELARKARSLSAHPSLAGWLYTTVRFMAANWRRSDHQRRRREEAAHTMNELLADPSAEATWQRLQPVLDDALHELNETDRHAVVLRFLEERPLSDVGARLGLTENAARMRVDRALDKLRALLERRGVTSTAAALTAAFAVGVVTPAPAALASTIAGSALATAAASSTLTLVKLMSLTKLKTALIGTAIVAGVALPVVQQTRLQKAEAEQQQVQTENKQLQAQAMELAQLKSEVQRLRKIAVDQAELERLRKWQADNEGELLRLRGISGVARRANAEAEELRQKLAQVSAKNSANQSNGMGATMADLMAEGVKQQMNGRLNRLVATLRLTPQQTESVRAILERQGKVMADSMSLAMTGDSKKQDLAALAKSVGNPEGEIKALLTPEQSAHYQEYQEEEAAQNARLAANSELLQMQSMVGLTTEQQDQAFAALYQLTYNQLLGKAEAPTPDRSKIGNGTSLMDVAKQGLEWATEQKIKALQPILTPEQLEVYRQQQAKTLELTKKFMGQMWTK